MNRFVLILSLLVVGGCGGIETKEILDAVQIGPDECGKASITGNLTVGSNPVFSTEVHVDIDKEKKTYTDPAGTIQDC